MFNLINQKQINQVMEKIDRGSVHTFLLLPPSTMVAEQQTGPEAWSDHGVVG